MDGEKDSATLQYEREIRIGMVLLGVLATVFIGVLAQRIWIENRQAVSETKKPIYLTKAQRDELRTKSKPRSIASLNASTSMKRLRRTDDASKAVADENIDPATIPDLQIGDSRSDPSPSRPANFTQPEESEEEETAPADAPPSGETTESPMPQVEEPAKESKKPMRPGEPSGHEEAAAKETAQESGADSPQPASALNPPLFSPSRKQNQESSDASRSDESEVVRKKVNKNPWKRPATSSSASKSAEPAADVESVSYTVQSGDTLKSIAKTILGDETRWREIYDLNRAEIGDDSSYIRKNTRLKLPKSGDAPPETASPSAKGEQIEPPSVLKK
jgi:nucleoid-associated protein YgaU